MTWMRPNTNPTLQRSLSDKQSRFYAVFSFSRNGESFETVFYLNKNH